MGRVGHAVPNWEFRCQACLGTGWETVVSKTHDPAGMLGKSDAERLELVDENTLASWLTHEIRKHEGCDRCEIVKVYKRENVEDSECNWRVGVFLSHNPDQEACRQNLNQVQDSAAEHFNLA